MASLLVPAACADQQALTGPGGSESDFSNPSFASVPVVEEPGFSFLPPVGTSARGGGAPLASLLPLLTVEVCAVDGGTCVDVVATFVASDGSLRLNGAHFQANWAVSSSLDPAQPYRLLVRVGPKVMGSVEVEVVKGAKGKGDGTRLGVQAGSTLPVKFTVGAGSVWESLPADVAWSDESGPAGAVGQLSGVTAPPGADVLLLVGGEPAPARVLPDGRALAALPLFIGPDGFPDPPADPVDVVLFVDGEPVSWAAGALTIVPPPDAPGSATMALEQLRTLGAALEALGDGPLAPSVEDAWGQLPGVGLAALVSGPGPLSLEGVLSNGDPETVRLLDAWFASSGVLDALENLAGALSGVAQGFDAPVPSAPVGPLARSSGGSGGPQLAPGDVGTQLPANYLAKQMQLYEVSSLLGEVVIAETATEFGNYVGIAAGAIGLVASVPGVAVTGAVLTVADFAVNKLLVGVLPSVVNELTLDIPQSTLQPGQETIAEVRIQASNNPPPIGLQDVITQALNVMGLPAGSQAQSFKEVLENVASFYLQTMRGALLAYAAENPDLTMDVTLTSVPSMTWWANVLDETLVEPVSLNPDVVTPLTDGIDWVASATRLGEANVYVRTVSGPESHRLDLPESITYAGGAFGVGASSSAPVTLNVVGELALRVDFADVIEPGDINALEARAGYLSSTGDTIWVEGISISLIVDGGSVADASGATDASGQFVTLAQLDPGSDEIIISVTATDALGQSETVSVSASAPVVDPGQIEILWIYAGYGGSVYASQSGMPAQQASKSEATSELGGMGGSASFSKTVGSSTATASMTHAHSVTQPGNGVLLLATVTADESAEASAQITQGGGARALMGSDLHLKLLVKDNPVYLVIEGQDVGSRPNVAVLRVTTRTPSPALIYEHLSTVARQDIQKVLTLPPGQHDIDTALYVGAAAGRNSSTFDAFSNTSGSYDLTFRVLTSPPSGS